MAAEKYIELIYDGAGAQMGEGTAAWLEEKGVARRGGEPAVSDSGLVRMRMIPLREIALDSAVLFVTDESTADRDWYEAAAGVPESVRLIPVGRPDSVNVNDPEVIPPRVEELNFIWPDEKMHENILDSLITDPDFYAMKNHLLVRYNTWSSSGFNGELMTDQKEILAYRAAIGAKLAEERDPFLKSQLEGISTYLDASLRYAKALRKDNIKQWIKNGGLILLAIAAAIVFFKAAAFYRRVTYANIMSSMDVDTGDPVLGGLEMTEAITNPFTNAASKKLAYEKMVTYMDRVWPQTAVGMNYKYDVNSVAVPPGTQYVWAAAGGSVLYWDTYTGRIEDRYPLSDAEMRRVAVSADGSTLGALDSSGRTWLRRDEKWQELGTVSAVDPAAASLVVSDDGLLVYSADAMELISAAGAGRSWKADPGSDLRVLEAAAAGDGAYTVAYADGDRLFTAQWTAEGMTQTADTGITVSDMCCASMSADTLAVTGADGQVWTVRGAETERVPLVLAQCLDICLVNDHTLIYHERNMGTGIYDTADRYDYGSVLEDFRAGSEIAATEQLMVMRTPVVWKVCDISDVLSSREPIPAGAEIYSGRSASADLSATGGRGPASVQITDNGVLSVQMQLPDGAVTALVDPALILHNSSGHYAQEDTDMMPEDYAYYQQEPFISGGVPVTVGIRYVPANDLVNVDYYYLVVGCADGTFSELAVGIESGEMTQTRSHVIPSRSPIVRIAVTDGGYLLQDAGGRTWRCSSGVNTLSPEGIITAMKGKIRTGVTYIEKERISKDLWDTLELSIAPGGDGKEWE